MIVMIMMLIICEKENAEHYQYLAMESLATVSLSPRYTHSWMLFVKLLIPYPLAVFFLKFTIVTGRLSAVNLLCCKSEILNEFFSWFNVCSELNILPSVFFSLFLIRLV